MAALGPGSSSRDYDALGISFEERWKRFDEAVLGARPARGEPSRARPLLAVLRTSNSRLVPDNLGVSRCGSEAGARRPGSPGSARAATAGLPPPTTRRRTGSPLLALSWRAELEDRGRQPPTFPTRWPRCGPGSQRIEPSADRVLAEVLAPVLNRDPDELARAVCVGTVGALRGAPLALRRRRMPAGVPLAVGRRSAAARARRERGRSDVASPATR